MTSARTEVIWEQQPQYALDPEMSPMLQQLDVVYHNYTPPHGLDMNSSGRVAGAGMSMLNFSREQILLAMQDFKQTKYVDSTTETLLIFFYSVLAVSGIVGNSLVCYVILSAAHMRTARNMYILLLSLSDITLCVVCVPLSLVKLILQNWPLGPVLCKLEPMVTCSNIYISTICIMAMAVDRYQAILSRQQMAVRRSNVLQKRELRRTVLVILSIVVVGFLLSVPVYLYSHVEKVMPCFQGAGCFFLKETCMQAFPTWQNIMLVLIQYLLPCVILLATSVRITLYLKRHQMRDRAPSVAPQQRSNGAPPHTAQPAAAAQGRQGRKSKAVSLLMAITIVFFLTWLPFNTFNLVIDFSNDDLLLTDDSSMHHIHVAFHLLAMSSACTNPILYGWLNNNFRQEFARVFHSARHKSSAGVSGTCSAAGAARHAPRRSAYELPNCAVEMQSNVRTNAFLTAASPETARLMPPDAAASEPSAGPEDQHRFLSVNNHADFRCDPNTEVTCLQTSVM